MASARAPRFVLRVLNGALEGLVVPIGARLDIGRASGSDLQLLGPLVSRAHAAVVAKEDGAFLLMDLLSRNGTLVGDTKVSSRTLHAGDVIRVGNNELIFERDDDTPAEPGAEQGHASLAITGHRTWADTIVAFDLEAPPERPKAPPTEPHGTIPDRSLLADERYYPGNLLADIVLYRNLRMTAARDGRLPRALARRFRRLGDQLQASGDRADERRAFTRFACRWHADFVLDAEPEQSHGVSVFDISVDGAKIAVPRSLAPKASAMLALPMVTSDGTRSAVFTARIAWVRDETAGLVFATPSKGVPRLRKGGRMDTLSFSSIPVRGG